MEIRKSHNKHAYFFDSNAQTSSIQKITEDSSDESTAYTFLLLAMMADSHALPAHLSIPPEGLTLTEYLQSTIIADGKRHFIIHTGDIKIFLVECNILTLPKTVMMPDIIKYCSIPQSLGNMKY